MTAFFRASLRTCVLAAGVAALAFAGGPAAAESMPKVKLAIGGASCICYLPTVLANQLGLYKQAGVDVEMISLKGGSEALTAVLGGSADVVSGYYEHTIRLAAKGKALRSMVVYDQFPGLVLVVSPKHSGDQVGDRSGRQDRGRQRARLGDRLFPQIFAVQGGQGPEERCHHRRRAGRGRGRRHGAGQCRGGGHARSRGDPAQGAPPDLKILADTRSAKDTRATFGGDYPGGALYAQTAWVAKNPKAAQALVDAMVMTLNWIHSHSPEEIAAKMPEDFKGGDPSSISPRCQLDPDVLQDRAHGPERRPGGARRVRAVRPAVADAKIDVTKTYTNEFVEAATKMSGAKH